MRWLLHKCVANTGPTSLIKLAGKGNLRQHLHVSALVPLLTNEQHISPQNRHQQLLRTYAVYSSMVSRRTGKHIIFVCCRTCIVLLW
jgi:hypothetical protein